MSLIPVKDLKQAISLRAHDHAQAHPRPVHTCQLDDALGCILAEQVVADFDVPRQNLSAMDGFALGVGSDLSDQTAFEVVGESCAGSPFAGQIQANQAVRIFTGAVVPSDADTVVMQENTDYQSIADLPYAVTLTQVATAGSNIRRQGEEITKGEALLDVGKRLNPADISLLASLGVASVLVCQPLTVGVIATGDELVAVGESLPSLANIYNSNTPTIKALLARLPVQVRDYGIIPDDLDQTKAAVQRAIDECDVIISSAGVSVGDYDYLTEVIGQLGRVHHYKVNMKPGKPFVFGEFHRADKPVLYFGLPGNPLSTIVGMLQFVRPALWQLSGCASHDLPYAPAMPAVCQTDITKKGTRQEFLRAVFVFDGGRLSVKPLGAQDSHRVKQMSHANCLLVLPCDCTGVRAGDTVMIEPFEWCFG
ncbi:molybdopterin biosynthesis protein MoeA [Moraxella bovoculi]|uniref:molybdopterin molybdotransferase MoeA n=1 Tax=Moraxella bovoculi TaxID=386891 RepID=UPI000624E39C|nr:gephyrin-like molybdotransferase Glp [Moraxella bovoculi]AKG17583.1 molybdopterin molybdenumtransferase MoeA [Moraxella bovoculi]AKG19383.1 molybdopterin biosynthesis protein MoeA [Moraxella bovoculi]